MIIRSEPKLETQEIVAHRLRRGDRILWDDKMRRVWNINTHPSLTFFNLFRYGRIQIDGQRTVTIKRRR